MKICKYCGIEIEGKHSLYANHVRWCNKNDTNGDKGSSKNDWRIIRLKDDLYRKDKNKWLDKLIDCIYNRSETIIKLY